LGSDGLSGINFLEQETKEMAMMKTSTDADLFMGSS